MSEPFTVLNLRQARKAARRAKQTREAEANRALFGRTKLEKQAQEIERRRQEDLLDGARREPD